MGIKATSTGEARKLIPAKSYLAIVCGVYDLGTQAGGTFGPKHQILLMWELHNRKGPVRDEEGRNLTISNFYTLSFGDKANLRRDVESMLNRNFSEAEAKEGYDIENLIGLPCRLQVEHGFKADNTPKDLVGSIMALDEDDAPPRAELNHVYFEITGPDCEIPQTVPDWINKIIKKSPEWTGHASVKPAGTTAARSEPARRPSPIPARGDDDDDESGIPF